MWDGCFYRRVSSRPKLFCERVLCLATHAELLGDDLGRFAQTDRPLGREGRIGETPPEHAVRDLGRADPREDDAVEVGRSVARNNLFKAAIFGNDPNWGRVLAAIGTTDAAFEPDRVDVTINGVTVCRGGAIGDPREGVDLTGRAITIDVDLKAGAEQATIWTNDLSIAYVHENSAYST